jgi:ribosomal protein S12 methylthiotransferase accessory factor YcaO
VERLTQQKLMAEGNEAHHALAHRNMECVERENPKLATGGSPAPRGWQTSDHCSQSGE